MRATRAARSADRLGILAALAVGACAFISMLTARASEHPCDQRLGDASHMILTNQFDQAMSLLSAAMSAADSYGASDHCFMSAFQALRHLCMHPELPQGFAERCAELTVRIGDDASLPPEEMYNSLVKLALVRSDENSRDAEQVWSRVLAASKGGTQRVFPLLRLADLYAHDRRWAESEALYKEAIDIHQHEHGLDAPDLLEPMDGLARVYEAQRRYHELTQIYGEELRIAEIALGAEPSTAGINTISRILRAYSLALDRVGRGAEAAAIRAREKALGPPR